MSEEVKESESKKLLAWDDPGAKALPEWKFFDQETGRRIKKKRRHGRVNFLLV